MVWYVLVYLGSVYICVFFSLIMSFAYKWCRCKLIRKSHLWIVAELIAFALFFQSIPCHRPYLFDDIDT